MKKKFSMLQGGAYRPKKNFLNAFLIKKKKKKKNI